MAGTTRFATVLLVASMAAGLCTSPGCGRSEEAKQRDFQRARALAAARAAALAAAGAADKPTATAPSSKPAMTRPTTATAPSRPAMRRVHVFITGRVQGVGFRAFTRYSAIPLKVTGWVRNLRDGRVEGVFEGRADRVEKLLAKVRHGPPSARVDKLQITEATHTGRFKTFVVRR